MPYKGEFGLEYRTKEEERQFISTRRLNGFHVGIVKRFFDPQVYANISGEFWNLDEPKGRGRLGNFGFDLRYACLDHWYRDQTIANGRFTREEVDACWATWKSLCEIKKPPVSHEVLFEHWRENRKEKKARKETNARKRDMRRARAWERKFQAERDPTLIFNRLKATLPTTSMMDEQLLRSFARMLSEANDVLWQAEQFKNDDGAVDIELIQDYSRLLDLHNKIQKQITDLLKGHGYDYQARRSRRESQTAAEVFDDFVDHATVLFDQRAVEMICSNCKLSLAYFIRNFPTVPFVLSAPCPRCNQSVHVEYEAVPDEVMNE